MVLLEMPAAVAFSQLMVFSGCGWPSSDNVSLMVRPYFTFMSSAPNSASAADDATHFNIVQRV